MGSEIERHGTRTGSVSAPYHQRQQLLARLRKMAERGEIERTGRLELIDGRWHANFIRIRDPRPRLPIYATAFAVGAGAVVGVGMMLWHARYVILYAVGGVAALAVLIGVGMYLASHRVGCPGVITHCPGCKH